MDYYDTYGDFSLAKNTSVRKNGESKKSNNSSPSIYSSKHVRIQSSKLSK